MRWQLEWRQLLVVAAIFAAGLFWGSRGRVTNALPEGSAAERLCPVSTPLTGKNAQGLTVYVPVYSEHLPWAGYQKEFSGPGGDCERTQCQQPGTRSC